MYIYIYTQYSVSNIIIYNFVYIIYIYIYIIYLYILLDEYSYTIATPYLKTTHGATGRVPRLRQIIHIWPSRADGRQVLQLHRWTLYLGGDTKKVGKHLKNIGVSWDDLYFIW